MDVLGSYDITVTEDGDMTGFKRRRRYSRSQAEANR
jgi:hypothetical protein